MPLSYLHMVDLLGGSISLPCPITLPTRKGSREATNSIPILILNNYVIILFCILLGCPILAPISLDFHEGKSARLSSHYGPDLKQRHL